MNARRFFFFTRFIFYYVKSESARSMPYWFLYILFFYRGRRRFCSHSLIIHRRMSHKNRVYDYSVLQVLHSLPSLSLSLPHGPPLLHFLQQFLTVFALSCFELAKSAFSMTYDLLHACLLDFMLVALREMDQSMDRSMGGKDSDEDLDVWVRADFYF